MKHIYIYIYIYIEYIIISRQTISFALKKLLLFLLLLLLLILLLFFLRKESWNSKTSAHTAHLG